jgi:hypothetical protein
MRKLTLASATSSQPTPTKKHDQMAKNPDWTLGNITSQLEQPKSGIKIWNLKQPSSIVLAKRLQIFRTELNKFDLSRFTSGRTLSRSKWSRSVRSPNVIVVSHLVLCKEHCFRLYWQLFCLFDPCFQATCCCTHHSFHWWKINWIELNWIFLNRFLTNVCEV